MTMDVMEMWRRIGSLEGLIVGLVCGIVIGFIYGTIYKSGKLKNLVKEIKSFIERFTHRRKRVRVRVTPKTFREHLAKIGWKLWEDRHDKDFIIINHRRAATGMAYRPSDNSIVGTYGCILFGKSKYGTHGNFRICLDDYWMDYNEQIGAVSIYKYDNWKWWSKSRKATYLSFYNFDDKKKRKGEKKK